MRIIGLIGGISWVSSADYYRLINEMVNERMGGVNGAEMIMYSVNYEHIKQLTFADDWEGISLMMQGIARKLQEAGAECILLGANTMHRLADDVAGAVSIPLIHIATETGKEIKKKDFIKKVALLGTKFTMELPFYRDKLAAFGLETITPDDRDRDFIHDVIYHELGKGVFKEETKSRIVDIITSLELKGAQGVILGCTELPMIIKQKDSSIPVFDTTCIHAAAAVDFSLH